ncbi:MAG: tetratricopeptide repeat protein [Sandaracinus sp.]
MTEESGVDQLRRRAEQAIASEQGRRVIVPLLERLVTVAPEGSPASLFAHRHLAEYRVEEHPWRALLSLRKVAAAQPDDDVVHALMGLAQALLSNFRAAIEAYRRALAIAPRNPWYHHNLGHLLDVALDRPDQALKHLELAHKATAPNDPEIAASLAHCLARLGKLEQARVLAAGAVAAAPRSADHKRLLEWIDQGAPAEAKVAPTPSRAPTGGSTPVAAPTPSTTTSTGQTSAASSAGAVPASPMLSVVHTSSVNGGTVGPVSGVGAAASGMAQVAAQVGVPAPAPQPVPSIPGARAARKQDLEAIDPNDPVLPIIADAMREGGFTREHVARARRLWTDYRQTRGSWELLKPDVCAAALEYAIARLHGLDGVTRASVARRYGVSASAIADRFDDMQVVLALRPADPRYYTV